MGTRVSVLKFCFTEVAHLLTGALMVVNVLVCGYEETCRGIKLLSNTLLFLISI